MGLYLIMRVKLTETLGVHCCYHHPLPALPPAVCHSEQQLTPRSYSTVQGEGIFLYLPLTAEQSLL